MRMVQMMNVRQAWLAVLICVSLGTALAQTPQLTLHNPESGYPTSALGRSTAIDGNTSLVGAPDSQEVRVYVSDGSGSWSQQARLVGPGAASCAQFGCSVSLSGDTAVIGARDSAYVFTRSGSAWNLQQSLSGTDTADGDGFGVSVSVSGSTAVVGADRGNNNQGAAYVFARSGAAWTQETKLAVSDVGFGCSTSVSGGTVVIGAGGIQPGSSGSVYVFTRSAGVWTEQARLTASDTTPGDCFGQSVCLSGSVTVVGALAANSAAGSAYIFRRNGSAWRQETKLTASDGAKNNSFGVSVSLSSGTAVIGACFGSVPNTYSSSGAAYVFTFSGSSWSQRAKLTASDPGSGRYLGMSVSVSGDNVVAGAPGDRGGCGSAYVFTRSDINWKQTRKLTVLDYAARNEFGGSVSVSGNVALVYSRYKNGSVYVYDHPYRARWDLQTKLTPPEGDIFVGSVSISSGTAIVGASSGSAYVFKQGDLVRDWSLQAKLRSPMNVAGEQFAQSVSLSGDRALIVAGGKGYLGYVFKRTGSNWAHEGSLIPSDDPNGFLEGSAVSISGDTALVGVDAAVYVFVRTGSEWVQQTKLTNPSPPPKYDSFGRSVALMGSTAIVGATGTACVFQRNGSSWTVQANLVPSGAAAPQFGYSVSLMADMAAVGAPDSDPRQAFVFRRLGRTWTQQPRLIPSVSSSNGSFGGSIAIDGGNVVIGDPDNDDPELDSGSATIFELAQPGTPAVSSFSVNGGAASTSTTVATLNNRCTNSPTSYMASESLSFGNSNWHTYSGAPSFTLSPGWGTKTVYFKVKNAKGSSWVVSDTITVVAPAAAVSSWMLFR